MHVHELNECIDLPEAWFSYLQNGTHGSLVGLKWSELRSWVVGTSERKLHSLSFCFCGICWSLSVPGSDSCRFLIFIRQTDLRDKISTSPGVQWPVRCACPAGGGAFALFPRGGFARMWRWPASFGSVIVSWGSTLLFSYSDTDMCLQVHVNLTVFEKHGCRISRNGQMNLPGGHEQILHVGKYDSLTCHLNFPKSCVLDSVKWYKVKKIKGFSYWYFLFFSLKPTCFFNLSCIFKAKLVKRLCISDRFVS